MEQEYIFNDYLEPIVEAKILQDKYKSDNNNLYNPALRECLKLLMNSLRGKMGQLPISNENILCDNREACDRVLNKYKKCIYNKG